MKSSSPPSRTPDDTDRIRIRGFGIGPAGERFVDLGIAGKRVLARVDNWGPASFEYLNLHGAHLISNPARQAFSALLQSAKPDKQPFAVATQIGFHGDRFVLPDRIIGSSKALRHHLDGVVDVDLRKFRRGGRFDAWKRAVRLARGNSRAQLALALAFTGPVGALLEAEQVAIQLVGGAGTGKTSIAKLAGSVWGRHHDRNRALRTGFAETWSHTVNHLDPVAAAHNHTLLALDETALIPTPRASNMLAALFRLESGTTRGRLNEPRGPSWWVPVLSTSNETLDQIAARERGTTVGNQHRGRLIDVPHPAGGHGIFESLHGTANVAALARRIAKGTHRHFGHAGPRFVASLCEWLARDRKDCLRWLKKRCETFVGYARESAGDAEYLGRVFGKFSTIYAAGCLAIRFNLLPFSQPQLRRALLSCLRAHLQLVAEASGSPPPPLLDRLRTYIADNQAEFVDLRRGLVERARHDHNRCPGYVAEHNGEREYLFSNARFARICGSKDAAQRLKRDLAALKAIDAAGGGADGKRFAVKRTIFEDSAKGARGSVIAIKQAQFSSLKST